MASNAETAPAMRPLAFMTKLSPCVYVYRPEGTSAAVVAADSGSFESLKAAPPKLILLATWMGARDAHIAKYLVQYQALYPSAPILLLRSEQRHFLNQRSAPAEFAPAVPFVRNIFPDLGTTPPDRADDTSSATTKTVQPQLLIHVWSNGGVSSLHNLRLALRRDLSGGSHATSKNLQLSLILPPYTLLLDSAPGAFRYWAGYLAFTAGLSGAALWLASPFKHALCAWYYFLHVVIGRGRTGPLAVFGAALNERAEQGGGNPDRATSEVRRAYVYGPGDRLVDWRDVEAHALEAEEKGFRVRREKFDGGAHVAHLRVDPERYWRVARDTWEGWE